MSSAGFKSLGPGLKKGEADLGTTIMAVEFDGGVVLGADSRTSTGTYVANRVTDKLTNVHDRVYCCRSGSAADTQAVAEYVRYFLDQHSTEIGGLPTVKTTAHLFQNICYSNKNRLMAGIIVAGWDESEGGSVYSVPIGGSCVRQPFTIGGSGSTYIYGYVDSKFKENMTRSECIDFVRGAVCHAMARDGSSGGTCRLCIIDKDGIEKRFTPGNELPYSLEGGYRDN